MAEEKKEDIQENVSTEETVNDIPETEEDILNPDTEEVKEEKETEDEEDSPEKSQEDKTDKKLFKKKQKTDKKQDAMKEKIEELEDRVKRQMAEFDNFRKRTEREKSAMFETGAKSVIEKILPIVDNFERGLASIPEEEKGNPFAEGMEMIYKQLLDEFEKMEIRPIPAVGEEFNPEFHNAVMQMESEEYESGIIARELQRGYTYRESVVRHSMVAVVS